jgi:hypothetical protein
MPSFRPRLRPALVAGALISRVCSAEQHELSDTNAICWPSSSQVSVPHATPLALTEKGSPDSTSTSSAGVRRKMPRIRQPDALIERSAQRHVTTAAHATCTMIRSTTPECRTGSDGHPAQDTSIIEMR